MAATSESCEGKTQDQLRRVTSESGLPPLSDPVQKLLRRRAAGKTLAACRDFPPKGWGRFRLVEVSRRKRPTSRAAGAEGRGMRAALAGRVEAGGVFPAVTLRKRFRSVDCRYAPCFKLREYLDRQPRLYTRRLHISRAKTAARRPNRGVKDDCRFGVLPLKRRGRLLHGLSRLSEIGRARDRLIRGGDSCNPTRGSARKEHRVDTPRGQE